MTSVLIPKKSGFAGRKFIHFVANGFIAFFAFYAPASWILPAGIIGFISVFLFDFIRLNSKRTLLHDLTKPLFKKKESFQASGLFWTGVAALIGALYAPQEAIAFAFAILAVADPAAGLIGKYTKSKRLYRSKTLHGVLAFFLFAFIVSLIFAFYTFALSSVLIWALLIAFILALTEMFSYPYDDNFTIILFATALAHISILIL